MKRQPIGDKKTAIEQAEANGNDLIFLSLRIGIKPQVTRTLMARSFRDSSDRRRLVENERRKEQIHKNFAEYGGVSQYVKDKWMNMLIDIEKEQMKRAAYDPQERMVFHKKIGFRVVRNK